MAQLIVFLGGIVVLLAVNFYGRFVFRRFQLIAGSPPQFIAARLHGARLALFWAVIGITVIVVVPVAIVAIGHLFGMDDCRAQFLPGDPWGCTPNVRVSFAVGVILLGLPLAAMWIRILVRIFASDPKP